MRRIYNSDLTKQERHRIADAIYRMKLEGFKIPSIDFSTISRASTYNEIRQQVAALPGVTFQAVQANGRRHPAIISAKLAEEYIEASRRWNTDRTKARKKGKELTKLPRYDIRGIGGGKKEYANLTQAQANKRAESTIVKQLQKLYRYTPETYERYREQVIRQNIYNSLNASIHNSKQILKLIRDHINNMSYKELVNFMDKNRELTPRLFGSSADELLLPTGSIKIPLLEIMKLMGINILQKSTDSPNKNESIKDYVYWVNLNGYEL